MVSALSTEIKAAQADPKGEYQLRLDAARRDRERRKRLDSRVGLARVAVFLLGVLLLNLVFAVRLISPFWLVVPVVVFTLLVEAHERIRRAIRRAGLRIGYYEQGLARLDDRWAGTGDQGTAFAADDHPYALDLDLFGPGSLFERLSMARTRAGAHTLASWLLGPAAPDEIHARQEAIDDLRSRLDLREDLYLRAVDVPAGIDLVSLVRWGEAPLILYSPRTRFAAACIVSLGLVALLAGNAADLGLGPYCAVLFVQTIFAFALMKRVNAVIAPIDRRANDLAVFASLLARIESASFQAPALLRVQAELVRSGAPPSRRIAQLVRIVARLEITHNPYLRSLSWLVLWTTQVAFALEAWRRISGPEIGRWLEAVARFEALSSLAAYAYENPDDPFPELSSEGACFDGAALGHPLIPRGRCIRNDVNLGGETRVYVISGSNMSGKSTLLRTVGINAVLAFAGAPVRARRLRLSPLALGATLRIHDSLQAGRSRFYAEIVRLRQLVDLSRGPLPLLFLLDEILHGTNSHDRRHGAEAVVRGLIERGALGLVTTHDLALTHIVEQLAPRASNAHFADHFENGTMTFDYQMRPGVVEHSNALALMRAVGLDV